MKRTIALFLMTCAIALAGPASGKRLASWTLPDSSGKYYDVLDYRGKVLLVDIMRTDCGHCQTLTKTLERVKARYGDKIQIVSIVNPPDSPKTVADYVAKYKFTSPVLFDFGQATAAMLKISPSNPSINLPHILIVDADGIVREDYAFDESLKAIFEGDGLFAIVDKALKPAAPKAAPAKK